jgi:hypothetical protein
LEGDGAVFVQVEGEGRILEHGHKRAFNKGWGEVSTLFDSIEEVKDNLVEVLERRCRTDI